MSDVGTQPARASGEFAIAGDLPVVRLGYGAMRIPGPGVWGEPRDHDEVIRVLRRAVELGVTFIDTADSYGPEVSERLIHEALHPYPADLVIATKAGLDAARPRALGTQRKAGVPQGPGREEPSTARPGAHRAVSTAPHRSGGPARRPAWRPGRAAGRRQDRTHRALRGLRARDPGRQSDHAHRHRPEPLQPLGPQRRAGPGLLPTRGHRLHPVVPDGHRPAGQPGGPLQRIADEQAVTPAQLALAWLLQRSPVLLPIPGTSTVAHLEENVGAALIELTPDQVGELDTAIAFT